MKLRYTPRALFELDRILSHIDRRSEQGASAVKLRVEEMCGLLREYPQAGQRTGKRGLRRVVVHPFPYLIFYRADETEIVIIGVRHAARKPSSMPS